jgi:hypothetical protein
LQQPLDTSFDPVNIVPAISETGVRKEVKVETITVVGGERRAAGMIG